MYRSISLSSSDFARELDNINQIAYINGFSSAIVNTILKKNQYNNCLGWYSLLIETLIQNLLP